MEIDIQSLIFEFFGGLGIFLLGIKFMGDGLQRSAGDRLRELLDKYTTNPFLGVITGIVVTILIQSSSATTVLTVGLVSAGFMTLRQAIGVIMGANIGTTMTAFIIGINIGEYALPILALGSFCIFFFDNQKVIAAGQALFGFGAIFFGLDMMSSGMSPLRTSETFHELTISMSETPILGVLIGTVFTVLIQSSTAAVGILQGLYAEGAILLDAALPVLFGDNVGTTITTVLAALGASVVAKRAALTHVLFNLIGATIILIFLDPFTYFIGFMEEQFSLDPRMTIAVAHGSYNVMNTMIQFPFIGALAWVVTKLVPGEDTIIEYKPKHLDPLVIQKSSAIALEQAKAEVVRMGEFAYQGLDETLKYLTTSETKHADLAIQIEGAINNLDRKITEYLVDISADSMTKPERDKHSFLLDTVRDIERIGDHFENIIELIDYRVSNKVIFTEQAMEDLNNMYNLALLTVKQAIHSLDYVDKEAALEIVRKEEQLDDMEKKFRKNHIIRVNEGLCDATAGIVFVDILSNLERIGDHAMNIAEEILNH